MALFFVCVCFLELFLNFVSASDTGCDWQRILNGGDDPDMTVLLQCRLKTINNADSVLSNLTNSQLEMITTLKLECNDLLFYESSLDTSTMMINQLKNLHDLKLEFCKIRQIPSHVFGNLNELRQLVIRSHNTDWSTMNMEFVQDSFTGLHKLKHLDLADNNIEKLPPELFCPLNKLMFLNLSKNGIQNVCDLGFSDWGNGPSAPGKTCNTGLEELDLSYNAVSKITDNSFTSLRSLQKMYLQNNAISQMADRAFVGLASLQVLNVSSNKLVALPPELFQSSRDLKEIYIQNNSINILAPGLFEGLDQLLVLDLSKNELDNNWINRDTFSGLVRLIVLNLGHNKLTKIDSHMFHDLYSLQMLNIEHNNIESITDSAFYQLSNLHELTLSHNNLVRVEFHYFSGTYVLNRLFLDHNQIEFMNDLAFENCTNLNDLILNANKLNDIPKTINSLKYLKILDLSENNISYVSNQSFTGVDHLSSRRLMDNKISDSKNSTCLPSLQVLNLAHNRIDFIEKGALNQIETLNAVRLDGNAIQDISGIFNNLVNLVWLNISDNKIDYFDYSFIPNSLEWLDMHKNNINYLYNNNNSNNLQIKMLDISYNKLHELDENIMPNSIEVLYLNNNLIKSIKRNTFVKKVNLQRCILFENKIESLDLSSLRLGNNINYHELPQFYLGNNPILCDCSMEWLQQINFINNLRQYPQIMDLDSINCRLVNKHSGNKIPAVEEVAHINEDKNPAEPPKKRELTKPLLQMKSSDFLCKYETHCFALCHCCDFDACDCEMTCPTNCTCYHDHLWSSNIVDCSNSGYIHVPANIPMDATEIYLDGNNLNQLNSHVFIGKKKLEVLYLNNSNISNINNKTFNGVPSLKVLHLENNNLKKLNGYEFNQLININELHLNNNSLDDISNTSFSNLTKLKLLDLNHNRVTNLSPVFLGASRDSEDTNFVSESLQLKLDENQFDCSVCNTNVALIMDQISNVANYDKLLCNDGSLLIDFVKSCNDAFQKASAPASDPINTTGVNNTAFFATSILNVDYIPFISSSLVILIIIILISIIIVIFSKEMLLFLYVKYNVRLFSPSCDASDKLYDGYVIYSIKDEEFINEIIYKQLQNFGFQLCLHHKDINVRSNQYLTESMIEITESSKRLILVLSLNLIQNELETFNHFHKALKANLDRIQNSQNKNKLIIIILLTSTNLINHNTLVNIELQKLLYNLKNKIVVLKYNDKHFWNKLRYYMPDVKFSSQTNNKVNKSINCDFKKIIVNSNGKITTALGNGARYTAAPMVMATEPWYKMSPQSSVAVTQSTSVSEESSQEDDPTHHSYVSIDYQQRLRPQTLNHHHVYCTIPEPIYNSACSNNGRTYFV
ncbi:unnamed protein product [Bemisia tabaci]|uniref:TIR domain-containing protein n=1 Tax=Bemisia tabaci TaxID=7038 RepID=A0A9P0A3T8_BEMTA|nr:PREDICTED: toll-like receptor 6 [Bemisia tabaci]CAH0385763.1 unnamed protein product [Bemisia tabaci]